MNRMRLSILTAFGMLFAAVALHAQPGTLDPTFNGTGYVIQPVHNGDGMHKVLVQPDQKILTIGMSWDATFTGHAYVFRYLPDGTLDTDFATDGIYTYSQDNEALFYSATLTLDGRILIVGATTDYAGYRLLLVRLNADGTPDASFGENGVVNESVSLADENAEDFAYDVTLDAGGNILICGNSHDANYVRRPVVVRFKPDGDLDTAFGDGGVATIPVMTVGSSAFKGVQVQPDGKIIATGNFGQTELWYLLLLVRFNGDGSLDETFGEGGIIKHNYGNVDDAGEDLQLTTDGSILVAGKTVTVDYNYSALLMKFTATGEVDATFGEAGAVKEDQGQFDYGWNLLIEADGRIVMAGTSGEGPPSSFDMAVWKYDADGTRDAGFGESGLCALEIPDRFAMIYGLAMQADGKILIGGQARTENNENHFLLVRLQNDAAIGIADVGHEVIGMVAPNPAVAGTTVLFSVDGSIGSDARIMLYAADGRMVHAYTAQRTRTDGGRMELQLPADLASGAYQVVMHQHGVGPIATRMIVR